MYSKILTHQRGSCSDFIKMKRTSWIALNKIQILQCPRLCNPVFLSSNEHRQSGHFRSLSTELTPKFMKICKVNRTKMGHLENLSVKMARILHRKAKRSTFKMPEDGVHIFFYSRYTKDAIEKWSWVTGADAGIFRGRAEKKLGQITCATYCKYTVLMAVYLQYILRHTESLLHFGLGWPPSPRPCIRLWVIVSRPPLMERVIKSIDSRRNTVHAYCPLHHWTKNVVIVWADFTYFLCHSLQPPSTHSEKFKMNRNTILSENTFDLQLIWNIFCLLRWDSHFQYTFYFYLRMENLLRQVHKEISILNNYTHFESADPDALYLGHILSMKLSITSSLWAFIPGQVMYLLFAEGFWFISALFWVCRYMCPHLSLASVS